MKSPVIGIVDYGMGNLKSVHNALDYIGVASCVLNDPGALSPCSHCILPGVGAFGEAMLNLNRSGWVEVLREWAVRERRPILGICLGMQLFASRSEEFGLHEGLGWIPGTVKKIDSTSANLRIPHIGWNDVQMQTDLRLYHGVPQDSDFYFVHSFHFVPELACHVSGTCQYGSQITASVECANIYAVQFHPEKSGHAGLRILKNFSEI